jgi:hypothetical protein
MKQIPNGIAPNTLNIKHLENKNVWQKAPEKENSRSIHKNVYTIEHYNMG